jgi:hypothetical protein
MPFMYEAEKPTSTIFLVDHGIRDHTLANRVIGRSIATTLRFLRHIYGVEVSALDEVAGDLDDMKIGGLYQAKTWMSLRVLKEEIVKYPPSFIREYIQKIRLASSLSIPHPSDKSKRLSLGGRATGTGQIYLDQDYHNEPYTRKTFHHEVAHAPDLVEKWEKNQAEVERWTSNNPKGTVYLGDAFHDLTTIQSRRLRSRAFAGIYGRKSLLEDRATIAEDLIIDPVRSFKRGEEHRSYKGKLAQIRQDYARRTNGRMGDQYFEDLAVGVVGEGYWRFNKLKGLFISCWAEVDFQRGTYKSAFKNHPKAS